jgi:hypothetical protein
MTDDEPMPRAEHGPGTKTAASVRRGDSLCPIGVVQDVSNFDRIEASNGIQQWQEELRILQNFKVCCWM